MDIVRSRGSFLWLSHYLRKDLLSLNYRFWGDGFVGVNTDWKGVTYNFVNVYASCNMWIRRSMWFELIKKKGMKFSKEWCLCGDFNLVTNIEEILGPGSCCRRRDM